MKSDVPHHGSMQTRYGRIALPQRHIYGKPDIPSSTKRPDLVDSSVTLSADKIDLNGITTVADTLHIGSENSLERKYLIFHKSGAVISATRGDVPELKLSAGKIDLCGTLYHNGQPLDL